MINVSWKDATSYTSWLSRKTGHTYRLPSEAEWEYAARAGTTTRYHFGNSISSSRANYGSTKTVAVGSYPANAFGLHDMLGNVWERVEDCWHESYAGAPSDTNVWKAGDCSRRVLRGGSWSGLPWSVRSALRFWSGIEGRYSSDGDYDTGFRIARTQGIAGAQKVLGTMYDDGMAAYERGDYATAVKVWRPLTEQGHADAQYNLGYMYFIGEGVLQNEAEAFKRWNKAAEQGHAKAQFSLGVMYRDGDGVPQNDAEAVKWFRKAAEQGHMGAYAMLETLGAN